MDQQLLCRDSREHQCRNDQEIYCRMSGEIKVSGSLHTTHLQISNGAFIPPPRTGRDFPRRFVKEQTACSRVRPLA